MSNIKHPLPQGTDVEAKVSQCPCLGSPFKLVRGNIEKVILNHNGTIWYYLSCAVTVNSTNVTRTF